MIKKLNDAIETLLLHAESGLRLRDFADEIRLVINALMALSCNECAGTGRVHLGSADTKVNCRICRCYRQAMEEKL